MADMLSSSSSSSPPKLSLCTVFIITYLKQTIYATSNAISHVECFVILHQHFPQSCVQCAIWLLFFWYFVNIMLSQNVAQVLSVCYWDGSSLPYWYQYNFAFISRIRSVSIVRSSYFKIFSALSWSCFCLQHYYYYYYYYYYHHHHHYHHHRIFHFSALAGKYSQILGCSNQQY